SYTVYRKGAYRTIAASDGFFAFERTPVDAALARTDAAQPIITAANCGGNSQTLHRDGTWRDLLTDTLHEGAASLQPGDRMLLEKI
ncbi:MAG: hypothetical protein IJH04_07615, partial [Eggerthellaceae bacterium]|nr:hypothetical protein [Eggerthellaceae bacterium]